MNARVIQGIIVIALMIFLSIWLGMSIVTSQGETLLKVTGAVLLIVCALLGRRIWLLYLFFLSLNVVLARGAGTVEVGQMLFLVFCTLLFLMRRLPLVFRIRELEFWALLCVLCVLQAYFRNPVGLNIFGGGSVGGLPYVKMGLSIVSALILSMMVVPAKELSWAMWLSFAGGLLGIPGTVLRYGSLTTSIEDFGRIPPFAVLSSVLSRILVSFISPLRALVRPGWCLLLLVAFAAAAGSAYRNAVAAIGLTLLAGIAYRGGKAAVLGSVFAGATALGFIAIVNVYYPLPGQIQRALSPFPGTWDERYTEGATGSTEWRVEMWKDALTSDRWIHNKLLGDGIGMSTNDYENSQSLRAAGTTTRGLSVQQETLMMMGSFHSGPVHSIRCVGYLGLAVLLITMIRTAVYAHRQIARCRGTEWFPLALYFGIPTITSPIFFVCVFGEYHTGLFMTLLGMAFVRLMERNLPIPAWRKPERWSPFMLPSSAARRPEAQV